MSPTTKRLLREAHELSPTSPNPSPYFHAAPLSDASLFEWHFTLLGPPSSPYANGIYHGRIVLPPQYPLRPPSFRFLTPSGRFEVNREICLSISGHHEETWQPAWGIRTALTAIRAFMCGDANGQLGGLEAGEERRRDLAGRSRSWRCVGCGGRSNEEILRQWGEDVVGCGGAFKEKEEGGDVLPEGLRVGYRDEMGKGKEGAPGPDAEEQAKQKRADASSSPSIPPNPAPHLNTTPPPTPTQPLRPQQQQSLNPPQQSQPQPPTQFQPPRQVQLQPAAISIDAQQIWIDRAIIAVVIALLVMILKKFFAE
jgi:ubiquitin-conjugating enzyme E2 J1